MSRIDVLKSEIEPHGFTVDDYSPGDGVTRYRFFTLADVKSTDYFAGYGDYTALGWKEAVTYATGRMHGISQARVEAEEA